MFSFSCSGKIEEQKCGTSSGGRSSSLTKRGVYQVNSYKHQPVDTWFQITSCHWYFPATGTYQFGDTPCSRWQISRFFGSLRFFDSKMFPRVPRLSNLKKEQKAPKKHRLCWSLICLAWWNFSPLNIEHGTDWTTNPARPVRRRSDCRCIGNASPGLTVEGGHRKRCLESVNYLFN